MTMYRKFGSSIVMVVAQGIYLQVMIKKNTGN